MRSLRLSQELDDRVRQAAALEGSSVSEFLRQAAAERALRTLATVPAARLSYAIGVVNTDLHQAQRTGEAFADLAAAKRKLRDRRK